MRPVNLIPPDERGGDRGPMRTGAFSYVLIGALALALLGVIALAFTSKQVSDRKSEVAKLQTQEQQAEAKAQSLQAFANFRAVQQQRSSTITSLAQSRFDWQRVHRRARARDPVQRLARPARRHGQLRRSPFPTLPRFRSATTSPGPALELVGCATSQDAVAGFVSALEEIDGVTRVGLQSSAKVDDSGSDQRRDGHLRARARRPTTECRTNAKLTEVRDRRRL